MNSKLKLELLPLYVAIVTKRESEKSKQLFLNKKKKKNKANNDR